MKSVLAIDGGGIGGIVAGKVLASMESRVGPLYRAFDLICGTSTGGIIALMLAHQKHYTARQVTRLYTDFGPMIFRRSLVSRVFDRLGLFRPQYGAESMESVLDHFLGDWVMASATTEVAVTAFNVATGRAELITNHNSNLKMWEAARATSAAPTYFPPYGPYIDGGIAANNPAVFAASHARSLWKGEEVFVLSVGCGRGTTIANSADVQHWGALDWLKVITQFFMEGSMSSASEEAAASLGINYMRIQDNRDGPSGRMDDVSPKNIEALMRFGDAVATNNARSLDRAAGILGGKKQ